MTYLLFERENAPINTFYKNQYQWQTEQKKLKTYKNNKIGPQELVQRIHQNRRGVMFGPCFKAFN
jgi:hypothetical protein